MKASEIVKGGLYEAKVGENVTVVRVDEVKKTNWKGSGMRFKEGTVYEVTNLVTGRQTSFRSAAKFRRALTQAQADRMVKTLKEARRKHVVAVEQAAAKVLADEKVKKGIKVEGGKKGKGPVPAIDADPPPAPPYVEPPTTVDVKCPNCLVVSPQVEGETPYYCEACDFEWDPKEVSATSSPSVEEKYQAFVDTTRFHGKHGGRYLAEKYNDFVAMADGEWVEEASQFYPGWGREDFLRLIEMLYDEDGNPRPVPPESGEESSPGPESPPLRGTASKEGEERRPPTAARSAAASRKRTGGAVPSATSSLFSDSKGVGRVYPCCDDSDCPYCLGTGLFDPEAWKARIVVAARAEAAREDYYNSPESSLPHSHRQAPPSSLQETWPQTPAALVGREIAPVPPTTPPAPSRGSKLVEKIKKNLAPVAGPLPGGCRHVIVEALAGTGKTTTIVEGMKLMKGLPVSIEPSPQQRDIWDEMEKSRGAKFVCFAAFNSSIAAELKGRVPLGCDAKTLHSLGFRAVLKAFPHLDARSCMNEHRTTELLAEVLNMEIRELRKREPTLVKAVTDLVALCKQNLVGSDEAIKEWAEANVASGGEPTLSEAYWISELFRLCDRHDVTLRDDDGRDVTEQAFELVPQILERAKDVAKGSEIDFDDQVWLPLVLRLPVFRFDVLLGDECVPGWTPVMLADGRSMTIKEIVESDEEIRVRAYDTTRGVGKNCRVVGKQKILNRKPLVKIKVKHLHRTGTNRKKNFIVCTVDHKVWTVNRGWVPAGQLQVGDDVIIETAAKTTQKGKITGEGREKLSALLEGNRRGEGNLGDDAARFNSNKGGNGRGPTFAEQILLDALGDGWGPFTVRTGCNPIRGDDSLATHYKLDLANETLRVAVEVDGKSHDSQEAKRRDAKKQRFLEETGWRVVRVSNRRAVQNTDEVVCEILGDGACPRPAKVVRVDPVSVPDYYVYDITVEDCHNFYANGILVHNCQDWNRCQQELAFRAGRRLILVGDKNQAVYGFAGSDDISVDRLHTRLEAMPEGLVTLPLTVTRRCCKAVVREAQRLVPTLEALPDAPEGEVLHARHRIQERDGRKVELPWDQTFWPMVSPGDFLLCRVWGPLVREFFYGLKRDVAGEMLGRDFSKGLLSLIERLCPTGHEERAELTGKVTDWLKLEVDAENAKRNPSSGRVLLLQDKADSILSFSEGARRVSDVTLAVRKAFRLDRKPTDPPLPPGVRYSSVHKAKGLEAPTVFLLQPKGATIPHPCAKADWQIQQEYHLLYVAITRSIGRLVYVS